MDKANHGIKMAEDNAVYSKCSTKSHLFSPDPGSATSRREAGAQSNKTCSIVMLCKLPWGRNARHRYLDYYFVLADRATQTSKKQ
jgi:hypothetical protein